MGPNWKFSFQVWRNTSVLCVTAHFDRKLTLIPISSHTLARRMLNVTTVIKHLQDSQIARYMNTIIQKKECITVMSVEKYFTSCSPIKDIRKYILESEITCVINVLRVFIQSIIGTDIWRFVRKKGAKSHHIWVWRRWLIWTVHVMLCHWQWRHMKLLPRIKVTVKTGINSRTVCLIPDFLSHTFVIGHNGFKLVIQLPVHLVVGPATVQMSIFFVSGR